MEGSSTKNPMKGNKSKQMSRTIPEGERDSKVEYVINSGEDSDSDSGEASIISFPTTWMANYYIKINFDVLC